MTAPIDTIPKPGSSSPSSSSVRAAPRPAGLVFDAASSLDRRAKPTPDAPVRPRIAIAAKAPPNAATPQVERDARRRGRASRASPMTPPSPVGSGQLPGAGKSEASAAAAATPTT